MFNFVEQIFRTRAEPQWIVATRLLYHLQYPVPIQVVCKGFTPAHIFNDLCRKTNQVFPPGQSNLQMMVHEQKSSILTQLWDARDKIIVSSTDSGLEAFSHNPTRGSFTPLSSRTGVNTNYVNERFLSY